MAGREFAHARELQRAALALWVLAAWARRVLWFPCSFARTVRQGCCPECRTTNRCVSSRTTRTLTRAGAEIGAGAGRFYHALEVPALGADENPRPACQLRRQLADRTLRGTAATLSRLCCLLPQLDGDLRSAHQARSVPTRRARSRECAALQHRSRAVQLCCRCRYRCPSRCWRHWLLPSRQRSRKDPGQPGSHASLGVRLSLQVASGRRCRCHCRRWRRPARARRRSQQVQERWPQRVPTREERGARFG